MTRNAYVWAFAVVAVSIGVACSSSDSTTNNNTSSSSGGTSGTGTTGSSSFKQCGSGNTSKCSQADLDTYNSCVQGKCDSVFQTCLGSGYKSGTFSGACGTYYTCIEKCTCGDTACTQACGLPDGTCQQCLGTLSCSQQCTLPACETAGTSTSSSSSSSSSTGGTGTHTCTQLGACCAKLQAGAIQNACNSEASGGQDNVCSAAYAGFAGQAPAGSSCDP